MRILRAGSTNTSHNLSSSFSSRNKNTSMRAPVFSLFPYNRAGEHFGIIKDEHIFIIKIAQNIFKHFVLNLTCSFM